MKNERYQVSGGISNNKKTREKEKEMKKGTR